MGSMMIRVLFLLFTIPVDGKKLDSYAPNRRSAVTYRVSGGRLGDNLLSFSHAAWIAYLHKLDIIWKPFPLCDQFVFSKLYKSDRSLRSESFTLCAQLTFQTKITKSSKLESTGILYVVPYFPDFEIEWRAEPFLGKDNGPCCTIDWNDKQFMKWLSQLLSPINMYQLPELPIDKRAIAIHVRHGGGFDPEESIRGFPYKFPPIEFYIKSLNYLIDNELADQPLYVFLFTDHTDPQEIVRKISKEIDNQNIVFDWRKSGNRHDAYVIEDFLYMQKFPYVIRPQSNYSYMAAKLGGACVEIEPEIITETVEQISVYRSDSKYESVSV